MTTPFSIKDIEATSDTARAIEQLVERTVTEIMEEIFKFLRGEGELHYSDAEWQRFTTAFFKDEKVRQEFNDLIIDAAKVNLEINKDRTFVEKFARYFRPKYEEKKDGMAQIIQLAGMGNLKPPKKEAKKIVQGLKLD